MPFDKVDPKTDFPALERKILRFWEETRAFEKLRELNRGKPKWSFLDGPITANNPMGVHHAWGRTYKDLYQRYHAALGRDQRYQNGFDCQGLWVEVEVEKEFGIKNKREIENLGIGKFVEACKARASKYAALQTEQSKRLGYWMDWNDSYYTMSEENNYGIWAFLKKCHEKGLIYKGTDVMPWCARCGTGLSHMEVSEGYRDVEHLSVFVKFPLRGRDRESLLVWTTTPWTLSSNVAAAVHPAMTYLKVRQGDEVIYVGKPHFAAARSQPVEGAHKGDMPSLMSLPALFKNFGAYEVVEEAPGSALVGLGYDGPFDELDGAVESRGAHRVIEWAEVTESEGTGIVHIAPGCGSADYHLAKMIGLPQAAPLFEDGRFKPEFGPLAGKRFDEVADEVLASLKAKGRLFARERYVHRYPHCWRCKQELVYRLVDEWFINMSWREEIMASARQARWIPEWGLDRELDWLHNMGDWMISKKRFWGLALPIWECSACGHFEVIGGREELKARSASGWDQFDGHSPHRPWVDQVRIRCAKCGDEACERIRDVGNPWLDASIVPFSTMGYFDRREYWEQWFPAEFVVEALPGQFRNWFYALLTVSTMMVGRSPFKVLKGHGLVLDDDGRPMHKSEGNAVWFDDAAEEFGVDVMRWLFAEHPPERNVFFGPKHTDEVRREVILPWWNVYCFFCNLARADGFNPREHTAKAEERTPLDRWILSDLHQLIRVAHEGMGSFNVARFCAEAKRFIQNLSSWYVRRSRRRFYGAEWSADKRAAYATLYDVLTTLNRMLAPITPFLSEEIYQHLVARQLQGAAESVHHLPYPRPDEALMDPALSDTVEALIHLVSLGRSARKSSELKVRQPLAEMLVAPRTEAEARAVEQFRPHILEELNVKAARVVADAKAWCRRRVEPNMKALGARFGKQTPEVRKAIEAVNAEHMAKAFEGGSTYLLQTPSQTASIEPEMVTLARVFAEGWTGAEDGGTMVLISTVVTEALKAEGLARDIVRNVQNLRKQADLDISDRITLALTTGHADLRAAIQAQGDYIREETLAVDLSPERLKRPLAHQELEIEGVPLRIELAKA